MMFIHGGSVLLRVAITIFFVLEEVLMKCCFVFEVVKLLGKLANEGFFCLIVLLFYCFIVFIVLLFLLFYCFYCFIVFIALLFIL